MDLERLLSMSEGKTLEFKRDLSSKRPVLRTLSAFANTAGGTIVFGIEDSGRVRGVGDPLAFEERLASIVSDGIAPRLVPDIDVIAWRGVNLVVVTVYPGPLRPYHVRSEGAEDGSYVRVGSTNRRADEALRAELARTARGESFDEMPMPELDSEAIDFRAVSESFAGVRNIRSRDTESLRLTTAYGDRTVPTVGGVLLFGVDRRRHFPDAWFQVGRFKGTTRTVILDTADIDVPLPEMVEAVLLFVKRSISMGVLIDGARNRQTWQFPLEAVREATINAIVHADYSQAGAPLRLAVYDDRIEIENPGLLLPGLTISDVLGGVSRLRNRVIGRVFRELGLIEQWGSGIRRMFDACAEAGLPEPLLEEAGTRFRVTLRSEQIAPPKTDAIEERIAQALLAAEEGLSTAQLARLIDRTPRATRLRLKTLVEEGVVVEVGTGPNDPLRRYLLAEERGRYGRS